MPAATGSSHLPAAPTLLSSLPHRSIILDIWNSIIHSSDKTAVLSISPINQILVDSHLHELFLLSREATFSAARTDTEVAQVRSSAPSAAIDGSPSNMEDTAKIYWQKIAAPWSRAHKGEGHQLHTPCCKASLSGENKHWWDRSTPSLCHCWWVLVGWGAEQPCQLGRFSYPQAKRNKQLRWGVWGGEMSYYILFSKTFFF